MAGIFLADNREHLAITDVHKRVLNSVLGKSWVPSQLAHGFWITLVLVLGRGAGLLKGNCIIYKYLFITYCLSSGLHQFSVSMELLYLIIIIFRLACKVLETTVAFLNEVCFVDSLSPFPSPPPPRGITLEDKNNLARHPCWLKQSCLQGQEEAPVRRLRFQVAEPAAEAELPHRASGPWVHHSYSLFSLWKCWLTKVIKEHEFIARSLAHFAKVCYKLCKYINVKLPFCPIQKPSYFPDDDIFFRKISTFLFLANDLEFKLLKKLISLASVRSLAGLGRSQSECSCGPTGFSFSWCSFCYVDTS